MINRLWHCVGQSAGTDIVNEQNRVSVTHCPTTVDDFLRAPLHLRIASLDRRKIKILVTRTAGKTRCCATAEAYQHCRPAQYDDACAGWHFTLEGMFIPDVANAASDHYRLVIAPDLVSRQARQRRFIGPKITEEIGPSEFVVEGCTTDRPIQHYLKRCCHAFRMRKVAFPWPFMAGYP